MTIIHRKKNISTTINADGSLDDVANAANENFMKYLKDFYNYDEVTLYTFEKKNKTCDLNIFDDAIHFICLGTNGHYNKDDYERMKNKITNYFNVLKIVKLTHNYERHSVSHYLFIDSQFNNNNEYKILIPHDYNVLNLLTVNAMTIKPINLRYDDFHMFFEFKEISHNLQSFDVSNFYFETVLEINFEVQSYPPLIKAEETKPNYGLTSSLGYGRKAQLIIRHYPDTMDTEDNYILNVKLILANYLIKSEIKKDITFVNDLNETINKFIFPLSAHVDFINEQNLKPELTKEFMDQDFSDFWNLHLMSQI